MFSEHFDNKEGIISFKHLYTEREAHLHHYFVLCAKKPVFGLSFITVLALTMQAMIISMTSHKNCIDK